MTLVHVALITAVRWPVGALLIVAGLRKISDMERLPLPLWAQLRQVYWRRSSRAVGLLEVLLGLTIATGAVKGWVWATAILVPTALVTSCVGTWALMTRGRCGCGLPLFPAGRIATLWLRNVAFFGAAVVAVGAGPSAIELLEAQALYKALCILPVAAFGFVIAAPAITSILNPLESREEVLSDPG